MMKMLQPNNTQSEKHVRNVTLKTAIKWAALAQCQNTINTRMPQCWPKPEWGPLLGRQKFSLSFLAILLSLN